jgi:hypothetical protein
MCTYNPRSEYWNKLHSAPSQPNWTVTVDKQPPHVVFNSIDRVVWMVSAVVALNFIAELGVVLLVFRRHAVTIPCSTRAHRFYMASPQRKHLTQHTYHAACWRYIGACSRSVRGSSTLRNLTTRCCAITRLPYPGQLRHHLSRRCRH